MHWRRWLLIAAVAWVLLFFWRPGLFYFTGFSVDQCMLVYAVNAPTATQAHIATGVCHRTHGR